jgi:hypothetical protein
LARAASKFALLTVGLASCWGVPSGAKPVGMPVAVEARPVGLGTPDEALGSLRYRGGLVLHSRFAHFGGLSSLRWLGDSLLSVSDEGGYAYNIRPIETGGRLVGIGKVSTTRLLGVDGAPLTGKSETDAESTEVLRDRAGRPQWASIGFERHDRVLIYRLRTGLPIGRPHPLLAARDWFARQPDNLGVEAMAGNKHLTLMISEGLKTADGAASALLFRPGLDGRAAAVPPAEIGVPAPGELRPCELAMLDDTHFLLVRRSWSGTKGFEVELDKLTIEHPDSGLPKVRSDRLASFVPPILTDNYEGAAIRREGGRTYLYLVSDDNFDSHQRTLLLKFELAAPALDQAGQTR